MNPIKLRQHEILEKIKELALKQEELKEKKTQGHGKMKIEIDKQLVEINGYIDDLDMQLYHLSREERRIQLRILKLCGFLIKYCNVSSTSMSSI